MSRESGPLTPRGDSRLPLAEREGYSALFAELKQAISGEVRPDRLSRALYSTDASVYQMVPLGVVLPRSEADIVATVRICGHHNVPITARGGGTSQAGQCIGPGIILDCSKYFNDVLETNVAERWVRVRPGCVLDDLNRHVKSHDLQFAPDISTASRATIGGMIANNSSGTHSLIHGKTIDHVLELRVLLSDGSIVHARPLTAAEVDQKCGQQDREGECYRIVARLAEQHADEIDQRFPKILRRVGGYNLDRLLSGASRERQRPDSPVADAPGSPVLNLAHLFVGSEGTLGVVLEARLRLVEMPRAKVLLVVQFHDLLEALAATPSILKHHPAAVEVMDRYILDATRLNADASRLRDFLRGDPAAILIIELYGNQTEQLTPRLEALEADLRSQQIGYDFQKITASEAQQRIWKLRTLALGLSMAEKGDAKAISFVEDSAVDPGRLRDYIAEFLEVIARHGTKAGVYAHASVGCLHVRPVIDLKTEEGIGQFHAIADEVSDLVLKYGGALSGEHGDGLVRSPFQEKMFGPALYQAFREIKRTFDPQGILNPGKIVDAPPLATNLRYGPGYVTPQVETTFDFSADGGFTRSAELCAGVGECRKTRGGTMCPSYRATREEQHSTRGRANTLRLALTGQVDLRGLDDAAVMEAMDLCLECKACKSECPTNVDMARLKAEVLHQHNRKHGVPWRNRLLGNPARIAWWGSGLAPVSNWLMRSRLVRWVNEKLFGIDRRRVPPAFARKTLGQRFRLARSASEGRFPPSLALRASILLFPDTFTNYYEPEIGLAAIDLFHRGGCCVTLGPPGLACCGRPHISTGQLDQAVRLAQQNVDALYPWADAGKPITACEPSCILTIKDDYPALLRGEQRRRAEVVAGQCLTFEEALEQLLARSASEGSPPPSLALRASSARIMVQSHCHQRSLVGVAPILRLLRRIPGAEVIDLDAGCCGMAGAFGYEKEHYEVSRLVGEQQLFPAIRAADRETAIIAPGLSCRMQIAHFTGREAMHPASLLGRLLG